MAITRAQQAKQMLQEGGRIGFRIGSGDKESKGRSYDTSGREYDSSPRSVSSADRREQVSMGHFKEKNQEFIF